MKNRIAKACRENRGFILFIVLMFVFRSAFADWNTVPTGSMKPTIVEGDRIFVNKMAYDFRVPFTHISLHEVSDPDRGDIIVFDSKASGKKLVKRVVGIPGDTVELTDNVLVVNGENVHYRNVSSAGTAQIKVEWLGDTEHLIRTNKHGSALSSFEAVVVPKDHYLALGDNRDNSADSRVIGFVPREEIVGKSTAVVLSLNADNFYLPRTDRFLKSL